MMTHIKVVNQNYHMQGFTSGGGFVYFSFTDSLVKTTPAGTVKCQTEVHGGHLGDIDYYDGKIYGSFLGNALPGHAWDDWTCFKIYVFDASDLRLLDVIHMDVCDEYKRVSGTPADTRGFSGIDGVAFGKEPGTGARKMFVACATITGERYADQILLQCTTEGRYEREYRIPTGNTVYGIQNLDYDEESGEFWFSTYGKSAPYQPRRRSTASARRWTAKAKAASRRYGFNASAAGSIMPPCRTASTDADRHGLCDAAFLKTIYGQELPALVEGA
ncbi:MAG: hypothetical protein ACLUFV_00540 [Acutalibacteraceae bacterium]